MNSVLPAGSGSVVAKLQRVLGATLVSCSLLATAQAQPRPTTAVSGQPAGDTNQVVIKRDSVQLVNPDLFRIPLALIPTRSAEIRSRVSGTIQNVRVNPGARVVAQEELIQIESTAAQKQLERARAQVKAATLRRELMKTEQAAGKQPQLALDLASAELEVAQADLELAQLRSAQTSLRAPFNGQVARVHTTAGASINEGELLLEVRDTTELKVELPVDRNVVKEGDTLTVQLDNTTATGKVQTLLPLDSRWQILRQFIDSAGLAVVVIDNRNGQYQDGQTVYSPIVPRQPLLEVANSALRNSEAGNRVVQVIRDHMVRDLEVQLLAPVGAGRSYVAGPFQERDELITQSSVPLKDGSIVIPGNLPAPATGRPPGNQPRPGTPADPGRTPAF